MMKIAAFPKCYIEEIVSGNMELVDWIRQSVELAPEGLELYGKFLRSVDEKYLGMIKREADALGLALPMMCHSPDFTIPQRDGRLKEIKEQKDMIRATAFLGGKYCRVLSGQRRPNIGLEQGLDWVQECIEECLLEAEKYGIFLVIENHYKDGFWEYPEFAQKKEVFLSLLSRIDSPRLGVQYDPSNALLAGDDPIDLLLKVKERVMTVHGSDRYLPAGVDLEELKKADGTIGYSKALLHGVTGKGLNDYHRIFSILREINFDGWISIEDGMNGMDEMKQSIDFLKAMRKKYFYEE